VPYDADLCDVPPTADTACVDRTNYSFGKALGQYFPWVGLYLDTHMGHTSLVQVHAMHQFGSIA